MTYLVELPDGERIAFADLLDALAHAKFLALRHEQSSLTLDADGVILGVACPDGKHIYAELSRLRKLNNARRKELGR